MLSLRMTQAMQERAEVTKGELRETAERENSPRRETRRQALVDTRNHRLANVDLPFRAARNPEPYPATERALEEIHSRMNECWTLGQHGLARAIYRANNAPESYVRSTDIKRMTMNGLEDEIRAAAVRVGAPWALAKEAELRASSQNNHAHHANAQGTEADETQDALATEIGGLGEVGLADLEAVETLLSIRENPLQTGRTTESIMGIKTADIEAALILMSLREDSHQKT